MENWKTPINYLGEYYNNRLWIKREDFIPFSFGGNKARKAKLFFNDFDNGCYDSVVTYGSNSSNHCRVIANECCKRKIPCYIVSPNVFEGSTFNSQLMELFNANIVLTELSEVHNTIENKISELNNLGMSPYFIEGGGHGNIGTDSYVKCYMEIKSQEKELGEKFDYIFLASGTGTTQAGLVCGKLLMKDDVNIIGISIARQNPRGRSIIVDSIKSYLNDKISDADIEESTVFIDKFTLGYGKNDDRVKNTIDFVLKNYGIPLDLVYTGKAFWGMTEFIKDVKEKNILFIHTGGTPLFFDYLRCI